MGALFPQFFAGTPGSLRPEHFRLDKGKDGRASCPKAYCAYRLGYSGFATLPGTIRQTPAESFLLKRGVGMAFQRKKPAAIGVKAPYAGFVEPALVTLRCYPASGGFHRNQSSTATGADPFARHNGKSLVRSIGRPANQRARGYSVRHQAPAILMSAHTSQGEEVILFDDDRALMHLDFWSRLLDIYDPAASRQS